MMLKDAPKNVTLIDPHDKMKLMVLSDYGPYKVKVKVIDVGNYIGNYYVAGSTKIVGGGYSGYVIFKEPVQSKISSATVNALKKDIENMEINLKSAKANLEKAEVELKKNIPALVVGGLYEIPEDHKNFHDAVILVIQTDDCYTRTIWFSENSISIELENTSELNDGTLIHLNGSEDKKFAKRLLELAKNFSF